MSDLKRWKCKNGHVLGQVKQAGHGRHCLYLFRQAIDEQDEHPDEQDVIAIVEGYVADVRCSVEGCGELRTWIPGQMRMDKLLKSSTDITDSRIGTDQGKSLVNVRTGGV